MRVGWKMMYEGKMNLAKMKVGWKNEPRRPNELATKCAPLKSEHSNK